MKSIAIIGLGYVGLPLAELFLQNDFTVYGIDINVSRIEQIKESRSQNPDVDEAFLQRMIEAKQFHLTTKPEAITGVDAVIICVPTPLKEKNEPDLSFVESAFDQLMPHISENQLLCLESTTYPGTTEEVLLPKLKASRWQVGKDVFLAYSPERINPGSNVPAYTIPKVVGGTTQACLEKATTLYEYVFDTVHPVSSTRAAEMTKILENTQRFVNISFINDFAMLCEKMNLDVNEVIEAAATKPYGFTKYYPGPGIGGHCIPIDPHYLAYQAEKHQHNPSYIEVSEQTNQEVPAYIAKKIQRYVTNQADRVLIVGMSYKPDIADVRESSAVKVLEKLEDDGVRFDYYDPFVPTVKHYQSMTEEELKKQDYVVTVILTAHTNLPISLFETISDHLILPEQLYLKQGGDQS
ncbi:nucleotide sugar dehydrogenase [Gracilibacillus halophilus YIM-C55.5]|uniref:Nucleotide sugar dehydrogenase n=1 Tax=Gracilibacillus halophilus YIM-C55.5 TaxID=1308866 RepID=N4WBJ8_9BACI|nr:nucleotide sugar dehydrogenase [Gracilibacillus halophilus]ENH96614.1 nucleotide sugar dehydrogenase [Gracilibacillus halophilus YIM-C55.5]